MMKINLKNNIIVGKFILLCLFVSSCANNENNFAEYPSASKPMVTATTTSFTVTEGETFNIPLTLEYVIDKPIDLQIRVTGGTATIFEDYEIGDGPLPVENGNPDSGFIARFSPFTESLNIPFSAILDMFPEGAETVNLNISAVGVRTALTKEGGINMSVTINNFASDQLGLVLSWGSDVTYTFINEDEEEEELTENLCDIVDFDVISYEYPGGYILGSSDCPEMDSELGVLADGTYEVLADLYDVDPSEDPLEAFNIPINVVISKVGKFYVSIQYDDIYNSDSATSYPNGAGDGLMLVATLVVSGGNYTVYDRDGNLVPGQ